MKNRLKNLPVKKRYLFGAIIALELAALPAAAQIMDRVVFDVKPIVTTVEIPTRKAGMKRYLVVSNAPFTVEASDMVGEISLSVHKSGTVSGNRFGDNAQIPGQTYSCAFMDGPSSRSIYQADKKTAAQRGTAVSQAVIFEMSFDASASPKIDFKAGQVNAVPATPCATPNT